MRILKDGGRSVVGGDGAGRGVLASVVAGVATLAVGVALFPVVLGTFGATQYGAWLFLVGLTYYFAFGDLGVGAALVHFLSRARSGDESVDVGAMVVSALLWSLVAGTALIPVMAVVSSRYLAGVSAAGSIDHQRVMIAGACIATGAIYVRPFTMVLYGSGLYVLERRLQLVAISFRLLGTLVACLAMNSFVALVLVESFSAVLPGALAGVACARMRILQRHRSKGLLQTWRAMTAFSTRSLSVQLVGLITLQGGTTMVGLLSSPASVAYFNAAFRIYSGVRLMNSWIVDPFKSALSRAFVSGTRSGSDLLLRLLAASGLATSTVCFALFFGSPIFVRLWLGGSREAEMVVPTLGALLLGLVLNSWHGPFAVSADARGRPGVFFPIQFAWTLGFLILSLLLIPEWGSVGAAMALSLPLLVVEPLYTLKGCRVFEIPTREWVQRCGRPGVRYLLVPAFVALLAAVGASGAGGPIWVASLSGLGAFLLLEAALVKLFSGRPMAAVRAISGYRL